MKRLVSLVLTVLFVLAGSMAMAPAAAAALTTQEPNTPIDQLTLHIVEGNGYIVLTDSAGSVQSTELRQVTGGEFPEGMSQPAKDFYTRANVRDVYITFSNMVPPGSDPASVNALGIEIRVATFADPASAKTYVTDAIEELSVQAEANGVNPALTPVETMPTYGEAISGFSGTTTYFNVDTGEARGEMPYTRFLAQVGSSIASASVSGEDPALNEAIALELVLAQATCIAANQPCAPLPAPAEFPNSADPPESRAVTATVIVTNANIRATPSTAGEIVAVAPFGQVLTITGAPVEADGYTWLPVTLENGVSGWVADQLVQINTD